MRKSQIFTKCGLTLMFFSIIKFSMIIIYFYHRETELHQSSSHFKHSHLGGNQIGIKNYPFATSYVRKDWHDWDFINYEKSRSGIGEQGEGFRPTDPKEIEEDEKLFREEGVAVFVSDKIPLNRSLPDTRPKECQHIQYLKNLPSTTVIVIFHNEWLSLLLRTIHSIYSRTPRELLKEIIAVNDNSTRPGLEEQVEKYFKENFDGRAKLINLRERKGLIVARMEGAKVATGEVLVFLDSHMEVNVNWLPPLLEVIAISPTTISTPIIDSFDRETFRYSRGGGVRGVFNEIMWYQWFPLRPQDTVIPTKPYQVPIMLGCAFAIRRDYFNDIGQNDEGLMIWNGEQIELSLKAHLCGGNLVEVPCSRASHFFRGHKDHGLPGIDVAARNFKRIGEVWMGEFKEVMYKADPDRFLTADAGDLTKPKMIHEKLNCKPFRYFLENIAPEMFTSYFYQADYPGYFAWGAIKSEAFPENCVDFMNTYWKPIKLNKCDVNNKEWTQKFALTWHRKIRLYDKDDCLQNNIVVDSCHYTEKDQFQNWKYDLQTKQLVNLGDDQKCLTASLKDPTLSLASCNKTDVTQKWIWGNLNETALKRFDEINYEGGRFSGFD